MESVISQTRQRFATVGILLLALFALGTAAVYRDTTPLDDPSRAGNIVPSGTAVASGNASGQGNPNNSNSQATSPIEGFLPRSGAATTCQEAIGVDLLPGYGAFLTINSIVVPPEKMNVNLDSNGNITNVITATRSAGHYTFEPDSNCPNGSLLRPTNNVLEVCVYRLSDVSQTCTLRTENSFNAT